MINLPESQTVRYLRRTRNLREIRMDYQADPEGLTDFPGYASISMGQGLFFNAGCTFFECTISMTNTSLHGGAHA